MAPAGPGWHNTAAGATPCVMHRNPPPLSPHSHCPHRTAWAATGPTAQPGPQPGPAHAGSPGLVCSPTHCPPCPSRSSRLLHLLRLRLPLLRLHRICLRPRRLLRQPHGYRPQHPPHGGAHLRLRLLRPRLLQPRLLRPVCFGPPLSTTATPSPMHPFTAPHTTRREVGEPLPPQPEPSRSQAPLPVPMHISLGHPLYANTERFHIFSDFSQLLA